MNRGTKNLAVFGLVLFFALGVLCTTLAAPGQALGSVTDCPQTGMKMTGCEHPSYLCGFDSSNLLSQGAISSTRPNDLFKNALTLVVGETSIDASNDAALLMAKECENTFFVGPHKVSIRLFNSIQNL